MTEITRHNFNYKPVSPEVTADLIGQLLGRVKANDFSIAGEKTERWQKGWAENLEDFRRTGEIEALEPKYLRPSRYLRLNGKFIEPEDPMCERNWYRVFRGWFARRYLSHYDNIYEFGCGSGHNVAFLAEEFPGKMIVGLDWAQSSNDIVGELAKRFNNVEEAKAPFDFFEPWDFGFPPNSAVLTVGALEQTGTRWRPFMAFLKRAKPAACFHIEPTLHFYDPSNPVDDTAIKIHEARGFWTGFGLGTVHRTGFGSLLLEGYTQTFWKPQVVEQARVDALEGAP